MTIKYKKNNILPAIIVAIAFSDTLINATSWRFSFIVLAVFVLIAGTFVFKSSTSLTQTLKYRSAMACIRYAAFPYVAIMLYSSSVILIERLGTSYFNRMIGSGLSNILVATIVASIVFLYKIDSVDIICDGIMLEYFSSIFIAITHIGVNGLIEHIMNPLDTYEMYFEKHAIGFSMFAFLLYYVLSDAKKRKIRIGLLIFMEYLIMKRVAILGFIAAIVVCVVYRRKKFRKFGRWCFLLFVMSIAYMLFSTNQDFKVFMSDLGILNRALFVDAMKAYYKFEPSYIGKGYGFVSVVLPTLNIAGFPSIAALHNDILKDYIELGFVGFILAYIYFFVYAPLKLYGKGSHKTQSIVLAILTYVLITLFTDNFFDYSQTMASLIVTLIAIRMNEEMNLTNQKS